MNAVDADRAEIGLFVNAMFVHADEGTFVSLRTFSHNAGDPPVDIRGVEINCAGLAPLAQIAIGRARRAARHPEPTVFAPPVATFNNATRAREVDLANGLVLSVEIDADAKAGLALLRGIVGPPTVVVASGGEWTDPDTGEAQPKLHAHWRLAEPTRAPEVHGKLKRARRLATALVVGGDTTNVPIVHPLRWPGSVHQKSTPKLARIVELDEVAEIVLGNALEALEVAAAARGISFTNKHEGGEADTGEARATADLIAQVLTAKAYTGPLTALSARLAGGAVTRPKIIEILQGFMLAVPVERRDGDQPGRWQSRYDGIPRMAASAVLKYGSKGEGEQPAADESAPDDIQLLTLDDLPPKVQAGLPARLQRLIATGQLPDEYCGDRSKAVFAVTVGMVRAGADDAQILGILLNPEFKIYEHIRDQKDRGPVADARRQIERAREHVEKEETKAEQPAGGNGHDEELAKLARLSRLEYDRCRKETAKKLGIRADTLDKLVSKLRPAAAEDEPAGQGRALEWPEPDPWPEPVNGADLLEEIAACFKKYVILPPAGDTAVSLWTLHNHVFEASPITPRLQVKSPEPRCGKTRVMEILRILSRKSLKVENITAAALFRTVEKARPTLILDEADTFISESEELRGILNSGHSHGGEVIRTVGDDFEPRLFSTWAPVAIAAIGKIPRTLEDRSIRIEMKRRARGETVEPWRADRAHLLLGDVHRKCVRWAQDHLDDLRQADPAVPDHLHDRARDNWRPLLAIADAAGGAWPERARDAAKTLSAGGDDADSRRTMLLADIRTIFAARRSRCKGCARCSSPSRCSRHTTLRRRCAAMAATDSPMHGRAICPPTPLLGVSIRPSVQNPATMRHPARITSVRTRMFRTDAHQPQTRTTTAIRTDGRIEHPRRGRGRGDLAVNAVALLREAAAAGVTVRIVEGRAKVEGKPEPKLLARLRETKDAIVEILTATRCRLCGERLRWPGPVGVTYADGMAECQPCADQEVGRIVAAAERITQSADVLGDEAELMVRGELWELS